MINAVTARQTAEINAEINYTAALKRVTMTIKHAIEQGFFSVTFEANNLSAVYIAKLKEQLISLGYSVSLYIITKTLTISW